MPTRKLPDPPKVTYQAAPCFDLEHNPPSHMVYENGWYEHTCPSCKRVIVFQVCHPVF